MADSLQFLRTRNFLFLGKKLWISRGIQFSYWNYDYYIKQGSVCIVNAASERDMTVFALGMIKAKLLSSPVFFCPSACFVTD